MATILVIEDNFANMQLISTVLETAGHAVLQATCALDGIEIGRRESPDLILMDIQLPGMDGLKATGILKADPVTAHIPVVALTAFAMKGDEARFRAAGCDDYVAKPFDYRDLLAVVKRRLELRSLTRLESPQRANLGVAPESGHSLPRSMDDMLDFSKVEADRLVIDPVPTSVAQVLARACQIRSGSASSRGSLLHQFTDPRISPALLLDPLRLGQILNHFISHVLKFTNQGAVSVAVELMEHAHGLERLRFTVTDTDTDTDIGVSAEVVGRFGDTDLGLAVCRRLADMMGGTMEMHSEPGNGTTLALTVSFPIADANPPE